MNSSKISGIGIVSIVDVNIGQWIPIGFWYDSRSFGQNKIFCIVNQSNSCDVNTQKFSQSTSQQSFQPMVKHLSLSDVEKNTKSIKLIKILNNNYESLLRNLIFTYFSVKSKILDTLNTILNIIEIFDSHCTSAFETQKQMTHSNENLNNSTHERNETINMNQTSELIDENLEQIFKNLDHINKNNSVLHSNLDFGLCVPNNIDENVLNKINKLESKYFIQVYEHFN